MNTNIITIMDYLENENFKNYIKNKTCRGCGNHCILLEPNCNRSRIFIKDQYEKYLEEKERANEDDFLQIRI